MFLLDTNVCVRFVNGTSNPLVRKLRVHSPTSIRLCSIVKAELVYGARHSSRPAANLRLLESFFAPFVSIPFDDACLEHYGTLRADLERTGGLIGPHDMLIAAIAMTHHLTLVTHNVREFTRVVGLVWEDWEGSDPQ